MVFGACGFSGSDVVTSVVIDPGTLALDITDKLIVATQGQQGTAQWSWLGVMYDSDAEWPAAGTYDVAFTMGSNAQIRGVVALGSGATETTTDSSLTTSASTTSQSITLTSSVDDLMLGLSGYFSSAAVLGDGTMLEEDVRGGSAVSMLFWSEAGTAGTGTIDITHGSAVSAHMSAVSIAGTGSGSTYNTQRLLSSAIGSGGMQSLTGGLQ